MIYRKQLAEGKDLTGEEIKAEIAAGNIEGYAKINKNHLRGIYRARHEKTGAELKKHMLEYTATAKLPNEKGELVHVGRGTFYVLHNMELPDLPWSIIPEDTIE